MLRDYQHKGNFTTQALNNYHCTIILRVISAINLHHGVGVGKKYTENTFISPNVQNALLFKNERLEPNIPEKKISPQMKKNNSKSVIRLKKKASVMRTTAIIYFSLIFFF